MSCMNHYMKQFNRPDLQKYQIKFYNCSIKYLTVVKFDICQNQKKLHKK